MHVARALLSVCPSVSPTVVQHLLGTLPLSPSLLSFYQGHLNMLSQRSQASSQQNRQQSTAAERRLLAFFNIQIQKIGDTVCYYIAAFFPKIKRERQVKKASVSAELSLALWLKP